MIMIVVAIITPFMIIILLCELCSCLRKIFFDGKKAQREISFHFFLFAIKTQLNSLTAHTFLEVFRG